MDARSRTVRDILRSGDQYLIPFFQRSYSWEKKHWERLAEDVYALLTMSEKQQHFLGPLVCTPGEHVPGEVNPYQLIDGQQRLTTLSLCLVALRDVCRNCKYNDLAEEIEEEFLVHKRRKGLWRYKIVPRLGDREILCALIDHADWEERPTSSLIKGYRFFRRWVERFGPGDLEVVRKILTAVADRLSLVVITITGENPYEIFESLNSTGLPLEESDLIRNYIFMQVPLEFQEEFNIEHWGPFEAMLQSEEGERDIEATEFYRDYLMTVGRYSKRKSTYVDFKDANKRREFKPADQVKDLRRFLRHARLLVRLEKYGIVEIDRMLDNIKMLDVSTANSLVMNLLERCQAGSLTRSELAGCLIDLASFVLRRGVCGLSTRGYGQWFVEAIQAIADNPRADLQQYYLGRGWPSDKVFATALVKFDLYKREAKKGRLMLECLEDSYGHKERVDKTSLTVEHIFPQSPNEAAEEEWKVVLGGGENWFPQHQEWVHTIGNLTLSGYNRELSNRPFSEKRTLLLDSNLVLNSYFDNISQWGPAEIESRGTKLAAEVAALWPNPVQTEHGFQPSVRTRSTAFDVARLREATVARLARHFNVEFGSEEEARFFALSGSLRLLCVTSQPYQASHTTRYWFGIKPEQLGFLAESATSYLAFACGSPDRVLLFTLEEFEPLTEWMNLTEYSHWHVHVFWGDSVLLDQPKAGSSLDVSQRVAKL